MATASEKLCDLKNQTQFDLPEKLSETCLYDSRHEINKELLAYKPEHVLWSDNAAKERWIFLPQPIDTREMNNWRFPVGTRTFKQFSLNGKKLETRIFVKTQEGSGVRAWRMSSYIWNEAQTEATINYAGAQNILGTDHDVPSQRQCIMCHMGASDANLSFSAFQQLKFLPELARQNIFTHPPKGEIKIEATPLQRAAVGYLHANCAHCHSPNGMAGFINLSYDINTISLKDAGVYKTAVNKPSRRTSLKIIDAGNPEKSFLYQRISNRGSALQMPPLATEKVDETGSAIIYQWIKSLDESASRN